FLSNTHVAIIIHVAIKSLCLGNRLRYEKGNEITMQENLKVKPISFYIFQQALIHFSNAAVFGIWSFITDGIFASIQCIWIASCFLNNITCYMLKLQNLFACALSP
ncbi:hypothetical protein ACJX0J_017131, partial [Zea mays]